MIKTLVVILTMILFPAAGGDGTEAKIDQVMNEVDLRVKYRDKTKAQWKKKREKRKVPTTQPEIVVVSDPDGNATRCLIFGDGRLTDCEVIVFRDSVAGELREQVRIATRSIGIPGLRVQRWACC